MDNFNDSYNNGGYGGYPNGLGGYTDPVPVPPLAGGPTPPKAPKKKGGARKVVALLLACALVGGGAGAGGAALYARMAFPTETSAPAGEPAEDLGKTFGDASGQQNQAAPPVQSMLNTNNGQAMTPDQLYAANLASCVGITVSTTSVNLWGQTTTSAASGSGFVLTQDGYIITNYHVIEDAAKDSSVTVEVSFADGNKYPAKLIGGEKDNDVAVLKIEATGLTAVTLGDSSKLVVGQPVYAIGNPLGELTYSLTDGLVSALDRLITTSSVNPTTGQREATTLNVFQTNCAINPGNSGGPLFDSYGNVIGITTAKYTQSSSGVSAEGLGFALPINDVKDIIKDLIENGYVTGKPYLGITVDVVSSDAQRYGIPAGAAVKSVADGSCAQKAGLRADDIIVAIDDTAIDSPSALTAALSSNYRAGDTAELTVIRSRETVKLTVTLDEKNAQTEANNQGKDQQQEQDQQLPDGFGSYFYQWPFSGFNW